jgi:pimeloyl-ACP methyl ester carboxylesterase
LRASCGGVFALARSLFGRRRGNVESMSWCSSSLLLLMTCAGALACLSGERAHGLHDPDVGGSDHTSAAHTVSHAIPQRHSIEVDGHPIVVWSKQAEASRDVIVLVHGRTWSTLPDFDLHVPGERRSLMDALVEQGFAVYGIDLRGYGATARDETGWITPDRAVSDVAAVLSWVSGRHPELEPPVLLGWSMGSLVSQLTAQRHPQRLSALILYGYPRDPDAPHAGGSREPARPARQNTTARAAASDFITPEVVSKATIEAFVEAALRADPIKADWRAIDELAALDPGAVQSPTLLIHGQHDPYTPIEAQAKLFTRLGHPDRVWVVVAGGDHAAHLEDTAPRFVDAVVTFVRRPKVRDQGHRVVGSMAPNER